MESSGSLNDLEEQLQELFSEVKTLIKLGKNDDAVDMLQANYEAVREQVDSGIQGIEEAAILDVIALGFMALGDLKTVASLIDLVILICKIFNYSISAGFGKSFFFHDIKTLAYRDHFYTLQLNVINYLFHKDKVRIVISVGCPFVELLSPPRYIGKLKSLQEHLLSVMECIILFDQLHAYNLQFVLWLQLHKIMSELNDEEPLIDSILMHMGNIYSNLGKFDLSIYCYRRSLQIMERKYGRLNFEI